MQTIKGFVENVVFQNEENGYKILELNADGVKHTLVGELGAAAEGDLLECEAEAVVHPTYGKQYKVYSCRILNPENAKQMEMYLASGAVKGIGPSLAAKIVAEFGEDTFRVMDEEPELLARIKGISQKKACDIALVMQDLRQTRAPLIFLQNYGIVGSLAAKILDRYGESVYELIRENPYRLAEEVEGVGFKKADEIALKSGLLKTSEFRIRSGILYTLANAAQNGDCYLTGARLKYGLAELLTLDVTQGESPYNQDMTEEIIPAGMFPEMPEKKREIPEDIFLQELTNLRIERRIFISSSDEANEASFSDEARVYEARAFHAEREAARRLIALEKAFSAAGEADAKAQSLDAAIENIENTFGFRLDPQQKTAVRGAVTNGVVLITGGPGTGKTTIIKTILRLFRDKGINTLLCAPTGRAAKRMQEVCGQEAKTIHRLLEVTAVSGGTSFSRAQFARDEDNPLETDAVIVDEMSMVDIYLFRSLLRAMTPGMRLIIVGDAAQLPSVGPGQVLRDIIESACFMTVTLDKIFRQAQASDIIVNAHRIHNGEQVQVDNKNGKDFFLLKRTDAPAVQKMLLQVILKDISSHLHLKPEQIQVLTPMRKGDLGVHALNKLLQSHINAESPDKKEYVFGEKTLREGDKVMQTKNNYQLEWKIYGKHHIVIDEGKGVFNGDIGIVERVNPPERTLEILFDDEKIVTYTYQEAEELELAYAVTIHKSQGSEYPAVVMPLLGGSRLLMNRNLLYTGVTRAKNMVVIVGLPETVAAMIANEAQVRRCTGLAEKIKHEKKGE